MRLEPYRYASEGRELRLRLPLSEFERLAALVERSEAEVDARLAFHRDEHGLARVVGHAEVDVRMRCANCEAAVGFRLQADLDLCVVGSPQAAAESVPELDPLLIETDHVTAVELLEDDLIMSLPERPCRGDPECPFRPVWEPAEAPPRPEPASPFAVLERLKEPGDGA